MIRRRPSIARTSAPIKYQLVKDKFISLCEKKYGPGGWKKVVVGIGWQSYNTFRISYMVRKIPLQLDIVKRLSSMLNMLPTEFMAACCVEPEVSEDTKQNFRESISTPMVSDNMIFFDTAELKRDYDLIASALKKMPPEEYRNINIFLCQKAINVLNKLEASLLDLFDKAATNNQIQDLKSCVYYILKVLDAKKQWIAESAKYTGGRLPDEMLLSLHREQSTANSEAALVRVRSMLQGDTLALPDAVKSDLLKKCDDFVVQTIQVPENGKNEA
jgi:hypothetical protein